MQNLLLALLGFGLAWVQCSLPIQPFLPLGMITYFLCHCLGYMWSAFRFSFYKGFTYKITMYLRVNFEFWMFWKSIETVKDYGDSWSWTKHILYYDSLSSFSCSSLSPFLPYSLLPADQDEELSATFSVPCMFVYCIVPYLDGNKLFNKHFRKPTIKWYLSSVALVMMLQEAT